MLIAVAKDSLWKAWGKWQYSMFFSLLMLFQAANKNTKKKKEEEKKLVWLVWKDCQMSSSYQTEDLFSFKKIPAEGKA